MVPRVSATNRGMDIPTERVVVILIAPMDLGTSKMTLVVALPIAPIIPREEEALVTGPMVSIVRGESIAAEVARAKELVMVGLPTIKVAMQVLPATAETLLSEAVGGIVVHTVVNLPSVQVVAKSSLPRSNCSQSRQQERLQTRLMDTGRLLHLSWHFQRWPIYREYFPWQLEIVAAVSLRIPCLMPVGCLTCCSGG